MKKQTVIPAQSISEKMQAFNYLLSVMDVKPEAIPAPVAPPVAMPVPYIYGWMQMAKELQHTKQLTNVFLDLKEGSVAAPSATNPPEDGAEYNHAPFAAPLAPSANPPAGAGGLKKRAANSAARYRGYLKPDRELFDCFAGYQIRLSECAADERDIGKGAGCLIDAYRALQNCLNNLIDAFEKPENGNGGIGLRKVCAGKTSADKREISAAKGLKMKNAIRVRSPDWSAGIRRMSRLARQNVQWMFSERVYKQTFFKPFGYAQGDKVITNK